MASSQINLPPGFKLEEANLPSGFKLESSGVSLPAGFQLEGQGNAPMDIPPPQASSPDAFGEANWHMSPQDEVNARYDNLGRKIRTGLSNLGSAIANPLQTQAKAYAAAHGAAEAAGATLSNIGMQLPAALYSAGGRIAGTNPDYEKGFGEAVSAGTLKPRTEKGKEIDEGVSKFFNDIGMPMIGAHPNLAPTRFNIKSALKGRAAVEAFKNKVNEVPVAEPQGLNPVGLPMDEPGTMFQNRAQQTELPFSTSPEDIALEQNRRFTPNQPDMFLQDTGGQTAAYPATDIKANNDFLTKAVQTEINDHPEGQPPFVGGQGGGVPGGGQDVGFRVDENGMPIRSDISMEAQNLQDPLQRNLWGDELPGRSQDRSIGITQALDKMPPGPERTAAIESLKSNSGWTEWDQILNHNKFGQGGGLNPAVFKEGFRALNKALSRLSDMPWVKERFPAYGYQTNPDGTPMVLLHGSRESFQDRPRGYLEGLHAGFATPATLKAAVGSSTSVHQRQLKFMSHSDILEKQAQQDREIRRRVGNYNPSAMYPVAIKKGNYPTLKNDYGSWEALKLSSNRAFALDVSKALGDKSPGLFEIEDILKGWREDQGKRLVDITAQNNSFARLLKDNFGIDGFFYENSYESAKGNAGALRDASLGNKNVSNKRINRLTRLSKQLEHPQSFVTWDNNNMESIFGETRPERLGPGHFTNDVVQKRLGQKWGQGGAIDISAIHDAVDKFKQGLGSAREVFASFKGTFPPKIMENLMDDINDPKARSTVVLMSPQQFKDLAQKRTVINPEVWQKKIDSIKEGLKSEQGLETNPFLWVDAGVKPNSLKVVAHEGRHRADVFQQQGIGLIPVEIRHQAERWGDMDSWPKEIIGQEKEKYVPFPTPLSRSKQYWSGGKFGQGGAANVDPLHDAVEHVFNRAHPYASDTPGDYLNNNIPGLRDAPIIIKPPTGEEMVARQLAAGVGPQNDANLNKYTQSGTAQMGDKVFSKAPIIRDIARNFKYLTSITAKAVREYAQPVEKSYLKLSDNEREMLTHALLAEDKQNLPFTKGQLAEFGATPKMLDTYNKFRQEMDRAWEVQNTQREAMDKSPLTKREAFVSSIWSGDYHIRINGKNENAAPIWYTQTHSVREARLAVEWLKDHFKNDDTVDANSIKFEFKPKQSFGDRTQAAIDVYHDMKEMFKDDPDIQHITDAMDKYLESRGMRAYGQQLHQVPTKVGVPGFEGNKPWKSDLENANALMEANIRYIENSHKWGAQQEITRNLKDVFNNKEIMDGLPNLMGIAKAYYLKHVGVDTSLFTDAEKFFGNAVSHATDAVGKRLPAPIGQALSLGSNFSNELVSGLKKAGYAGLLGFSRMYLYATPLQAIHGALAEFHELATLGQAKGVSGEAFLKELMNGLGGGILASESGVSHAGKPMYKWAIENDVLRHSLVDEYSKLNKSAAMRGITSVFDQSISRPDQLFRTPVFMTFAGLLERSGEFPTKEAAWQRAGEITENVMVNMRRTEGPLLWDKFGSLGNAASMMQQPLFNFYNQLSRFAKQDNKLPALTYIAAFAALAGVYNMPGVRELDAALEGIKNVLSGTKAEWALNLYHATRDWSIKGYFMKHFDDSNKLGQVLSHGGASAATGLDFSSRMNQQVLDPAHPLGNLSPLGQEVKEWAGAGRVAGDPTNLNRWAQTGYQVLPPALKEILETSAPPFRTKIQPEDKNIIGYKNPNDLESNRRFMERSQSENEVRKWVGGRSLSEAQRLERTYMRNAVSMRDKDAADQSTKLALEAFTMDNPNRLVSALNTAKKFDPDLSAFRSKIEDDIKASGMSPEAYEKTHLNSIMAIRNWQRKNQEYGVNPKPQ